jgi:hypothetical protein
MKNGIKDFLLNCENINFGKIDFLKRERSFCRRFNNEILYFCRSLPESTQTDSILFLMRYAGINLGDELNFFAGYYPPSWSILYWLSRDRKPPSMQLKKGDISNAVKAQSMAMLLHSLDDHLTDRQLPPSPLIILLRSQAWMIMNRAFFKMAKNLPGGTRKLEDFLSGYYSGLQVSRKPENLDTYCQHFRKQMGIGFIAPVLLSMKMNGKPNFILDIEMAYGSFGIAWRLLDDIKDIESDFKNGARSAIYFCLPKKLRTLWTDDAINRQAVGSDFSVDVFEYILKHHVIDKIRERITSELESASAKVEAYGLSGLANELKLLAQPLNKCGNI